MAEGKVAKNTAFLLTAYVGQKVLTFAYFAIIARLVGVEGSGRYFVAVSFAVIFSILLDLGLGNVITRETARLNENAGKLLANILGVKLVLAALTVPLTMFVARLIGYSPETRTMIAVAALVTALDSFSLIFYGVMRGFQNLRYEAIGIVTGQFITIAVGTAAMLLKAPLVFLVIALLCGSAWNVAWSCASMTRHFRLAISLKWEKGILLHLWRITAPFALAGIFSRIYSNIDSVMLSRLVSERAVGFYGAAYKVVFAFMFLPTAFASAIYPAMSEAYARDRARLGRMFAAAIKYLLVVAAPLVAGIFVLAGSVIRLAYGGEFSDSVLPLRILIFSLVFAFLYWPVGSLLNACDRQARNTLAMGVTMASNVILNALLIPRIGAVGAAISALAGNVILFVLALSFTRGLAEVDWRRLLRDSARIISAAALMAAVVWMVRSAIPLVATVFLGAAFYGGALIGFGGMSWPEIKELSANFLQRGRKPPENIA